MTLLLKAVVDGFARISGGREFQILGAFLVKECDLFFLNLGGSSSSKPEPRKEDSPPDLVSF